MKKAFRTIAGKLDANSPVILSLSAVSLLMLIWNMLSKGWVNGLFAVYYTSFSDPMQYVRLLSHCIVHQDMTHYTGNFLLILAIGPLVEEKYGSAYVLLTITATSVLAGLINIFFFRNIILLGASGIAFMLILMGSFSNIREGKIPLTFLLAAILYIGNEIIAGIFATDNISHLSHIIGGLCGAISGLSFHKKPY